MGTLQHSDLLPHNEHKHKHSIVEKKPILSGDELEFLLCSGKTVCLLTSLSVCSQLHFLCQLPAVVESYSAIVAQQIHPADDDRINTPALCTALYLTFEGSACTVALQKFCRREKTTFPRSLREKAHSALSASRSEGT